MTDPIDPRPMHDYDAERAGAMEEAAERMAAGLRDEMWEAVLAFGEDDGCVVEDVPYSVRRSLHAEFQRVITSWSERACMELLEAQAKAGDTVGGWKV